MAGVERTVGQAIAERLAAAGVGHAYTVPGESFLGLLEELGGVGIRVITARHEGGAGFMAEAHGQLTGRPAALLVTRAVGAANASIALHTAASDSAPLVALIGQVPRRHRGREAFQEVDQPDTFGRLTKWAAEPSTPIEAVEAIDHGLRISIEGRPGPVLVALAEDLLDEIAPLPEPPPADRRVADAPSDAEVDAVLALLRDARDPVILAGAGVLRAGATEALTRLAAAVSVPVIASWRRGDVIDNDHPLYLGMTGYWAPSTVLTRLQRADAILVIGCRLNDPTTFGYRIPLVGTRRAVVDLDPTPRTVGLEPPAISVRADAGAFLARAVDRAADAGPAQAGRRERIAADRAAWEAATQVDAAPWTGPGVHPGRVVVAMQRALPPDAIVTTDAGNFAGWVARGYRFHEPGTFLGPTSGAMGYALPAAIAASVARPDRVVVAVAGDGGLGMTIQELDTAVREGCRLIILCFDNRRYGTIRMWQERRGRGQGVATELGNVDYAGVAAAFGATGEAVTSDQELPAALERALGRPGPTLLHLAVDARWVSVDSTPEGQPSLQPVDA